jgi:hypothetical protein
MTSFSVPFSEASTRCDGDCQPGNSGHQTSTTEEGCDYSFRTSCCSSRGAYAEEGPKASWPSIGCPYTRVRKGFESIFCLGDFKLTPVYFLGICSCNGLSYTMNYVDAVPKNDDVVEVNGNDRTVMFVRIGAHTH